MRWKLLAAMTMMAPAAAMADGTDEVTTAVADQPQVALAAELGATGGGGATPGGMRVGGHYLYRLSEHDWFDGSVAFTFGQPTHGCGRVAPDGMACNHGVVDGFAGDLSLGVRRDLPGKQGFVPFVRAAAFGRVLRFTADDVTGAAIGGELGLGVRAPVRGALSVLAGATASAGLASLGSTYGSATQLALTISAGAEYQMQ